MNLFAMSVITVLIQSILTSCWDQNNSLLTGPWAPVLLPLPTSSILTLGPYLWSDFHSPNILLMIYTYIHIHISSPESLNMPFHLPERLFLGLLSTLLRLGTVTAPIHKDLRIVPIHSQHYIFICFYPYYY